MISGNGAVLALVFHGYAVDEHVVESSIVGQERGGLGVGDFAEGFFQGVGWDGGIQAAEGIMEAACEEDILEGLALGGGLFGGDVGTKDSCIAQGGKPLEGNLFNERFGEGHGTSFTDIPFTLSSPDSSFGNNKSRILLRACDSSWSFSVR